ncbi:MAG TPA: glycosyltransferase family 39 protein [Phycisphaerales bacterium]|nr:glycosyltransferase family 39 protein [Phycisphaerales bacterium]
MGRSCRFAYLFLGLFLGLLFFGNLGSYGLLEDNEARFFEIAWEMEESGNLVTPKLNFINHFHKPPATFWLVGLSLKCLGATEGAGRLPVVLAAIATVALTSFFLPQGEQRVFLVLVLACNLEFWLLSRTVLTDMFLTLSVTACMLAAYRLIQAEDRKASALFWISLGFSTLVKGPVGPAIVFLALLSFHLTSQRLPWRRWSPVKGVLLFSVVALPWYLLVCSEYSGLLEYFAGYQTVERLATTVHGRAGPVWFFLPVVLIGFLPWSPALPASLRLAVKRSSTLDRFLLSWLVPSFLLFSLSGSKLPTYILPLFPALALLVASHWGDQVFARRTAVSTVGVLGIVGLAVLGFSISGATPELKSAAGVILISSLVCLGGAILAALLLKKARVEDALEASGVAFGAFLIVLSFGLNLTDGAYSARRLATAILARADSETVIAEYADHLHGLPYYLDRRLVQVSYPRETQFEEAGAVDGFLYSNLQEFLAAQGEKPIILVLRRSDYSDELFSKWEKIYDGRWLVLERRPFSGHPKYSTIQVQDHEDTDS